MLFIPMIFFFPPCLLRVLLVSISRGLKEKKCQLVRVFLADDKSYISLLASAGWFYPPLSLSLLVQRGASHLIPIFERAHRHVLMIPAHFFRRVCGACGDSDIDISVGTMWLVSRLGNCKDSSGLHEGATKYLAENFTSHFYSFDISCSIAAPNSSTAYSLLLLHFYRVHPQNGVFEGLKLWILCSHTESFE